MALPLLRAKDQTLADEIEAQWLAGVAHKRALELYDKWDECDKFVQGDQWPRPTPETADFPRPVTNFVFQDKEFLVAALLGENPVPYFIPREGATFGQMPQLRPEAAKLLTEVGQFTWDNLDMDTLLEDVVDSGFTLGTGIFHFRWDHAVKGGDPARGTFWVGDIKGEEIQPEDFFPGNPKQEDVQRQPWVIVAERRPLDRVKEEYREFAGKVVDTLRPDPLHAAGETRLWVQREQERTDYITLKHKWWKAKRNGEDVIAYAVVAGGKVIRHQPAEDPLYPFGLYPFVAFRPYRRRKSFWGLGIVELELAAQKERNRLDAMILLSAYRTGAPAVLYKPESNYSTRKRTNMPGEQIEDASPPGQWGVRYLEPPQMPAYPFQWMVHNREMLKQVVGAHDALVGRQLPGHQNASAIAYLQQTGFLRVNKVRKRLYRAIEECVKLWFEFWRHFYRTARLIRLSPQGDPVAFEWFTGTDYQGLEFDVRVKAGPGTILNRQAMIAEMKEMLARNIITPEEYIEFLPDEVFPYKEQVLERRKQEALRMLAQGSGGGIGAIPFQGAAAVDVRGGSQGGTAAGDSGAVG